jgi:Flp pilus assembly pilin Flp
MFRQVVVTLFAFGLLAIAIAIVPTMGIAQLKQELSTAFEEIIP